MTNTIDERREKADIETSSEDYAKRFSGKIGSWLLKTQQKATLEMLASYPGASILDVGGGHGQLTCALVGSGYRVTVLGSAEICRRRIQHFLDEHRCSFVVGDILNLPYSTGAFDFVISYRLLSHITLWKQFLAEMARVATTGVMIDYPTVRSFNVIGPGAFQVKKRIEGNTRPFNVFNEAELIGVFESFSFMKSRRYAQFFLPMVVHRVLKSPCVSAALERGFRLIGVTNVFGSPVILQMVRKPM